MREYSTVLLPNWVRFDLGEPVTEPLTAAVVRMLEGVPTTAADRVRPYLFEQLFAMLTQLAAAGASAVYLPAENPAVASTFPIFSVRPADFVVDGETMDPMDYLVGLVAGGATLIEPEGMVGVRRLTDRDTTTALREGLANVPESMASGLDRRSSAAAEGAGRLSREIEYVIGVPQSTDRWMAITASVSVVGGGEESDELLQAVTAFADRWVETIRWAEEDRDA